VLKKLWIHYFIPQEKNNHRAAILKPNFLLLFLVLYLLNQSIVKSLTIAKPGILGYSSEITAQKVLDQTNNERTKLGLTPLVYNSVLSESAKEKADDMFTNNYWAHNSPQGKTPWTFFDAVGYKYSTAGENLAKDFYNTDSLVKAWMNSPTHKANIINNKYKEIGIAVVNGTLGDVKTTLVVQHFGTPLMATAQEIISQKSDDIVVPEAVDQSSTQEITSQANVLSENKEKLISPLTLSKIFSSIIFIVLIITLFIDGFITVKNNIHRFTGSTAGHIGFLFFIFLIMLFNQQGSIF
jgi:uncharacterized protein YkwD